MQQAKIVAEIGCNHKGDMEIASEMIKTLAIFCKVDAVKFQKRNPKELLTEKEYNAPHPNPIHSYGSTYGAHRESLEFNLEEHKQLKKWCEENGLIYSASVWDLTSARDICSLAPSFIKIPSACNLNFQLLTYICDNYPGTIHLSFGMTTQEEEENIISFFQKKKRNNDVIVYCCTSGYPVAFQDVCLLEISRVKEKFSSIVKEIGFSGHHLGISVDIAAFILGVSWIERHFTLDRTWKGTDHAASLEPDGMRKLARDVRNVAKAVNYKKTEILEVEKIQRHKLKRNQMKWIKS